MNKSSEWLHSTTWRRCTAHHLIYNYRLKFNSIWRVYRAVNSGFNVTWHNPKSSLSFTTCLYDVYLGVWTGPFAQSSWTALIDASLSSSPLGPQPVVKWRWVTLRSPHSAPWAEQKTRLMCCIPIWGSREKKFLAGEAPDYIKIGIRPWANANLQRMSNQK